MNAMDQPTSRMAPRAVLSGHLKEGLTIIDVVSLGSAAICSVTAATHIEGRIKPLPAGIAPPFR